MIAKERGWDELIACFGIFGYLGWFGGTPRSPRKDEITEWMMIGFDFGVLRIS